MSNRDKLVQPDPSLHWVGDEHPLRGPRQRKVLEDWGLTASSDVLEIGCGNGRLAYELADVLVSGTYTGFDIGADPIAWLSATYTPVLPSFRFDHLDVANPRWRPDGGTAADELVFPYPDDAFDMVVVFDVFMHLRLPAVANYLREIARVLRPGARAVTTWKVILPGDDRPMWGDRPYVPIGGGVHTRFPERDGYAMAFDADLAERLIADAGLELIADVPGRWHDLDAPIVGRGLHADLYVAMRPHG